MASHIHSRQLARCGLHSLTRLVSGLPSLPTHEPEQRRHPRPLAGEGAAGKQCFPPQWVKGGSSHGERFPRRGLSRTGPSRTQERQIRRSQCLQSGIPNPESQTATPESRAAPLSRRELIEVTIFPCRSGAKKIVPTVSPIPTVLLEPGNLPVVHQIHSFGTGQATETVILSEQSERRIPVFIRRNGIRKFFAEFTVSVFAAPRATRREANRLR